LFKNSHFGNKIPSHFGNKIAILVKEIAIWAIKSTILVRNLPLGKKLPFWLKFSHLGKSFAILVPFTFLRINFSAFSTVPCKH
jgi:hypothetical protein